MYHDTIIKVKGHGDVHFIRTRKQKHATEKAIVGDYLATDFGDEILTQVVKFVVCIWHMLLS